MINKHPKQSCPKCAHVALFVLHSATFAPFLHRSSVVILHTLTLFIPSLSAIILPVRQRSLHTFCLTRSTFLSVLLVDGLPPLWSSSTSSLPSFNLLCHSKRQVLDIVSSPKTSWSNFSASVGVFQDEQETSGWFVVRCSFFAPKKKKAKDS